MPRKDIDSIEKANARDSALLGLAVFYRNFLVEHRNQLAGCLTEKEVAELARLQATYIANKSEPEVDEEGNPCGDLIVTHLFDNPIPLRKP